jgi:ABC-type multidrug transport system ATPase subunit
VIDVTELSVRFGATTAVDGVSFKVAAGSTLALWGANGAGKSTVIRAILGLQDFTGTIRVGGHDVRRKGRCARELIGYVPQQLALYDDLRALDFLRFVAGLRRAPSDQPEALLHRVALAEHGRKPVAALSGGMKQRLALAAALLGDPPVLILDEPTASLDAEARAHLIQLLGELRRAGKTMMITSHRSEEVAALADDILVMVAGRPALSTEVARVTAAELDRAVEVA